MIAYHFVGETLKDGRPIPKNGVWLKHAGPLEMCRGGLHASKHPNDALRYAPGPILCKVELRGKIVIDTDKVVADQRKIISRIDATKICRDHARWCALSVVHLWDCPEIVREYLTTGKQSIQSAAKAAAWAAAGASAWASAWDAAGAAAKASAWAAAGDAAWASAWDAAGAAAKDAAWAAAGASAWASAWDAAGAAAKDAAWDATWDAAVAAQRKHFMSLVEKEFSK